MPDLADLKLAAMLAHQRYMDAQRRGDELEAVRLWIAFMDATKAVSQAKKEQNG